MPKSRIILLIGFLIALSSCRYNSGVLFRAKKDYPFDDLSQADTALSSYRISPFDVLNMKLYSNDGFKLIDLSTLNSDNNTAQRLITQGINYNVEQDGLVKLPILGRIKISGFTLKEAESMLEEMYSVYYIKPFVVLNVNDRRVVVFPGGKGDAKVISINEHTTLIEGIALAGGIAETGKAKKVRLVRRLNTDRPKVYTMDLSRMEGLEYADIILQADDMILVEPKLNPTREVIRDVAAYIGIISSTIILYTLAKTRL